MVYAAAHTKVATFNANGLTTKVPVSDNFSEDRQVQICRFLYRNSVHVMGLQEAHIKDDQCLEQLTKRFKDWGFVLLSNLSPKGRGGSALIFHNTWTLLNSYAIEKRHLFAQLADPDGVKHHFCVYHFHHDAVERQRQWTLLSQVSPTLVPGDTIYLSDHTAKPDLAANECAPVLDRRRRIDRILLHENFQNSVVECYTRFVANSDHKAVIASLSAKPTKQGKRLRIPTTFLSSEDTLQQLQAELHSINTEGYSKWADGLECIKTAAFSYEKANRATGITELQSLLMVSSTHHLSEEAWRYLKDHGYTPSSAKAAYQILTALAERADTDRSGQQVLDKLKTTLHDPHHLQPWRRRQEIWRLTKQLQFKRKLYSLRNRSGQLLPDPESMVSEIVSYWQQTMNPSGKSQMEVKPYLKTFFRGKNTALMAKMLIQPLSLDLVHAALESLNGTSAPGIDGVQVSIYKAFSDFFCPLMLDIYKGILDSNTLNDDWSLALLNPIPKGLGTASVHNLRPLVLQNTSHKWVAAILALQLRDYIDAFTPIQQRGFIRGRSIFTNLWHTFGSWNSPGDALFCPIDFKKAFDSVSHEYTRTFLNLMQLPDSLISLCLLLFTAPICVLVRDHIYTDHKILPRSGVRQGCPFSPTIFAMLISPIIHKLMDLSEHVQVLLYADDLIIIIECDPATGARVFLLVWSRVQEFSTITGLYTNLDKSNILLKGHWDPIHRVQLLSTGLRVVDKYKYLGIVLGATTAEEAYGPALRKATGRAFSMQSWSLSLAERVELLQSWILPLLVYPSRVVYPTDNVIAAVKTIYRVALKLSNWGITLDILSHSKEHGGLELAPPDTFLLWQFSTIFIRHVYKAEAIPKCVTEPYERFATEYGINVSPSTLHTFQMGSNVAWHKMPYLAWSARAYSLVTAKVTFNRPEALSSDTPLWHNRLFSKPASLTYYCPQLIRQGVITVGDLFNNSTHISQIAPTWASIYQQGVFHYHSSNLGQVPTNPPLHPVPGADVWSRWTTKSMALFLCSTTSLAPRQPPEVWKAFHLFNIPAHHKDFMRQVLWLRLPVGERQKDWKPDDVWCPIDGELETIDHARTECSLLKVAFDTISKCFPTATVEERPTALLSSFLQFSFQCPTGFLAWAAVYANWKVRQKEKYQRQYSATWSRFVSIWIATLKLWATCPSSIPISDHDLHLFIGALQSLLHDGVLQHPHLRVTPPTPPPSKKQRKETARRLRKQQRAAELEGIFDTLSADGYTLVFTDGSSAETEGVGRVAGYGIYAHPDISISAYVPVHFRQTNNTAELLAVVRALQILSFGKVAICTDSEYVFLGATGAARRWKLRGWTGSSGPVSNVPLWELLLDTLSAHTGSIKFIKVPSHVDILGNNEADRLAEQGRLSHPRCPVLKTPSRDFIMPTYTPPTKRQRRSTVAELDSIVQVLNFSPYKDNMGGSVV